MHLSSLTLTAFRNYDHLTLPDLSSGFIAFAGHNGAGKTNILEAISLLSPGRGMRNAEISDIQQREYCRPDEGREPDVARSRPSPGRQDSPWAIHARIMGRYGPQDIGLGMDTVKNRRITRVNGAPVKSQADLAELIRCVWLTPLQDRLFIDGASARRKLIDRWIFIADPAHAGRMIRLERLLSERNRLLSMSRVDPLWIDAVEADLAATAVAVMSARIDYLDRLRGSIARSTSIHFPAPTFRMAGFMDDMIGSVPAVMAEKYYLDRLRETRASDASAEATTMGPHRVDIHVEYAAKNMPAHVCSTGEQKALLFSLFLAHTRLIRDECGEAPLILLDEITAHLDPARRAALFDHLRDLGAQVFLTATTSDQFTDIPSAQIFNVTDGLVSPTKDIQGNSLSPRAGIGLG